MIAQLANFDPISFLGIDKSSYSDEEVRKLREDLMGKIGEYVLLKCSTSLTDEQLSQLSVMNGQQLLYALQNTVPGFDNIMLIEIENFKKDYQTAGGQAYA